LAYGGLIQEIDKIVAAAGAGEDFRQRWAGFAL
jgi:hypothetical protein